MMGTPNLSRAIADDIPAERRVRLGMLTPSSNTVLEPVCGAMLRCVPEVSVHFGRFRVTEISLRPEATNQFDHETMLQAAGLLADAKVKAICWNGTSACWLGLNRDRDLCHTLSYSTGVPATSSVLALFEVLRKAGLNRIGLVTPYVDRVQELIVETFAAEGLTVADERHLGLCENFSFAQVRAREIAEMIRNVAATRPQAVLVLCTNLRAAPLVADLEAEIGLPILDSVATAVWGALRLAGVPPGRVSGWGLLFQEFG
jgi:maleate isomerase